MPSSANPADPGPDEPAVTRQPERVELTLLLQRARAGDAGAADVAFRHVHEHLRALAGRVLARAGPDRTLNVTALVSESYLRLFGGASADWTDRGHFFSVVASSMRSIVIDHARARARDKRRHERVRIDPAEIVANCSEHPEDAIDLHEALKEIDTFAPELVRLANLRYFAGLPVKEVAALTGISQRTLERELTLVRALLRERLTERPPEDAGP